MGIRSKEPIYNCELCHQPLVGKMVILQIGYNWQMAVEMCFHEACFLDLLVEQHKGWPKLKFQKPQKIKLYFTPRKMYFRWRIGQIKMYFRSFLRKLRRFLI